jgi:hypothetical protein
MPLLAEVCSFIGNPRAVFVVSLLTVPVIAQAQQLENLSLEELMRIDAGRVFGASERNQPVTEAPASVSFITAEDIARHGYRTLADILRGVRGMYGDAAVQQPDDPCRPDSSTFDPGERDDDPANRSRPRPGGDDPQFI